MSLRHIAYSFTKTSEAIPKKYQGETSFALTVQANMSRIASVESVLQEKDFDTVWSYLEKKFGYTKEWRLACHHYIYERQRLISYKPNPVADFLFFWQRDVNSLLNLALCRNEYHPTFMRMLWWMFQDRIQRK